MTSICLRRCQDIAVCLKFFSLFFSFIEIGIKFRTAYQDHQAGESVVKCLSQGHNRIALVGFEPRPCQS